MKLSEYISTVAHVLTRHKTDAEIGDALAEGHGMGAGGVNGHFDLVMGQVRDALSDNKKLLGVFDGGAEEAERVKSTKEKEINPEDLRRHILAVRHSLRRFGKKKPDNSDLIRQYDSPESIMERILNDLSVTLGVTDIGRVFGPEESEEYKSQFGREKKSDEDSFPIELDAAGNEDVWSKFRNRMPPAGTPAYDRFVRAVMDQLRREGKIK